MLEPGRFRAPRSDGERAHAAEAGLRARLYPERVRARLFVTHTRPEVMLGVLSPLHTGASTAGLGFVGAGGTLSIAGMLFVNGASWAHTVAVCARLLDERREAWLSAEELAALDGRASPHGRVID
jgi:phosphoketolase